MNRPFHPARPASPALLVWVPLACTPIVWMAAGCVPSQTSQPPAPQAQKVKEDKHDHDHDHDDHAHPETLAAGVKELEGIATAVKTHLDAGDKKKADDAVHLVGHLVEDLRGLLPKEKLSAEAQATAGKALDEIFDAFDAVDVALHADEGKSKPATEVFASAAEKIQAALETLKGL
ncbi:MAG: hypothetical protein ACK6CT_14795 [Planctomycetia bacterium]